MLACNELKEIYYSVTVDLESPFHCSHSFKAQEYG